MYFEMSRDNFDIIHIIGIRSFQSFIAALISKKKKIPLVISDQGGLTTHPELTSSLLKKILVKIQEPFINFIIKSATKISVPNEYEKNIFLEYCDESKITIIPNGINLDIKNSPILDFKKKYNISSNFILFLGRFSKIKGLDILLQSIHILKKQLTDKKIKFIIMGVDFGFETEMLNTIRNLNISELVSVIKNPPREDVIQAYRESNFLVYPSRWELSPLTPLEAFAFKKAVISTDAHGIPFTLQHDKNSLLVKSGDSKLLAEAILELINDEQKCNLLGNTGHELVIEKCNSNQMVKDTLGMYEQLIKE